MKCWRSTCRAEAELVAGIDGRAVAACWDCLARATRDGRWVVMREDLPVTESGVAEAQRDRDIRPPATSTVSQVPITEASPACSDCGGERQVTARSFASTVPSSMQPGRAVVAAEAEAAEVSPAAAAPSAPSTGDAQGETEGDAALVGEASPPVASGRAPSGSGAPATVAGRAPGAPVPQPGTGGYTPPELDTLSQTSDPERPADIEPNGDQPPATVEPDGAERDDADASSGEGPAAGPGAADPSGGPKPDLSVPEHASCDERGVADGLSIVAGAPAPTAALDEGGPGSPTFEGRMITCRVQHCGRTSKSNGLCSTHYQTLYRRCDRDVATMRALSDDEIARLLGKPLVGKLPVDTNAPETVRRDFLEAELGGVDEALGLGGTGRSRSAGDRAAAIRAIAAERDRWKGAVDELAEVGHRLRDALKELAGVTDDPTTHSDEEIVARARRGVGIQLARLDTYSLLEALGVDPDSDDAVAHGITVATRVAAELHAIDSRRNEAAAGDRRRQRALEAIAEAAAVSPALDAEHLALAVESRLDDLRRHAGDLSRRIERGARADVMSVQVEEADVVRVVLAGHAPLSAPVGGKVALVEV